MSPGWTPASTGMEGAAALEVDVLGFRDGFFPDRWAEIKEAFPSQTGKPWFTGDTFLGLSRLRRIECSSEGGHAVAFHERKIVAGWGVLPPSGGSSGR